MRRWGCVQSKRLQWREGTLDKDFEIEYYVTRDWRCEEHWRNCVNSRKPKRGGLKVSNFSQNGFPVVKILIWCQPVRKKQKRVREQVFSNFCPVRNFTLKTAAGSLKASKRRIQPPRDIMVNRATAWDETIRLNRKGLSS